jgi:tetratricopeptide (TPR) repeat protein
MPKEFEQIRCQRCRAANPFGQELCEQCGTRLMLVIEPNSLRYEEDALGATTPEGLLAERVSVLENHLTRFAEKLERTLDLMLKQVQSAHLDHLLLDALIGVLAEAKALDRAALSARWKATLERDERDKGDRDRWDKMRETFAAAFAGKGKEKAAFVQAVGDGVTRLAAGDYEGGLRSLERAAAQAPANFPLQAFLGEHFFGEGRTELAAAYLARARGARPPKGDAPRVSLLLGLALADSGEVERARELLGPVAAGGKSFAASYALGRLSALAGDWDAAAPEFRRAVAARPESAEAHFVLALAQHQRGRQRLAQRHALKALEIDANFGEAFYLLGLVHRAEGDTPSARRAFERADFLIASGVAPAHGRGRRKRSAEFLLHTLFGAAEQRRSALLTSGGPRFARLLRQDALSFGRAAR